MLHVLDTTTSYTLHTLRTSPHHTHLSRYIPLQHLASCGVLPLLPIVTTQWFIALFVFWLPTETLLRLWDCFFYEGLRNKNKIFFRVALTLFKVSNGM